MKAVQDSSRITEEVRNELDQTNKKLRDQNHDLEDKMKMYSDVEELFSQKRRSRVQSSLGELRTPDSEEIPQGILRIQSSELPWGAQDSRFRESSRTML